MWNPFVCFYFYFFIFIEIRVTKYICHKIMSITCETHSILCSRIVWSCYINHKIFITIKFALSYFPELALALFRLILFSLCSIHKSVSPDPVYMAVYATGLEGLYIKGCPSLSKIGTNRSTRDGSRVGPLSLPVGASMIYSSIHTPSTDVYVFRRSNQI